MSVFTIADLHLSTSFITNKSMEVFGNRWKDYENKIKINWNRVISPDDTVVIPGDISWATTINEAKSDFDFIENLNGKKIIGKGNHDFWWSTMSKMNLFLKQNNIKSISFLYNNAFVVEDFIVAGTRGWFYDMDNANVPETSDYQKLISREAARLKISLDAALELKETNKNKEIIVFLHFPPIWNGAEVEEISDMLSEYEIKRCYFGHIHGSYNVSPCFNYKNTDYVLISSDYINFIPRIVSPLS